MAALNIFICYRREDSVGLAGRIYDRLTEKFGRTHIYRDIDTITAGEDFTESIREKLTRTDILFALIGPRWLNSIDEEGRYRLADENDLVRFEIATALNRNIRVIPILLHGAAMPKTKDLPDDLSKLSSRNAVEIRDTHFDHDVAQLINSFSSSSSSSWGNRALQLFTRWPVYLVIVLLSVGYTLFWFDEFSLQTPEEARIQIVQMGMKFDEEAFLDRVKANDVQAVNLFLRAGMKANAENHDKETAIQWAAENGNYELVKKLISSGADPSNALRNAIAVGQKNIFNFLLTKNPSQLALNEALHQVAGMKNNMDVLKLLVSKGADINFEYHDKSGSSTVLSRAVAFRLNEYVRFLIEKGADVNFSESEALFSAIRVMNIEAFDLLISNGADVNKVDSFGFTPLHAAIGRTRSQSNDKKIIMIQKLLESGANIAARSHLSTPLMYAIERNRADIALYLSEQGANVNDYSETSINMQFYTADKTALMLAVVRDMPEVAKALLSKGADVNARNKNGDTALLFTVIGKNDQILPMLIAHDADANVANAKGETVLIKATQRIYDYEGNGEDIALLQSKGIDVNAKDIKSWTALMYAAKHGSINYVERLLSLGADPLMKNDEDENAVIIAMNNNHKKIVRMLNETR